MKRRRKPKSYTVSAPGATSVSYPRRGQARRTAGQVQGAKVTGSGCLLLIFAVGIPLAVLATVLVHGYGA